MIKEYFKNPNPIDVWKGYNAQPVYSDYEKKKADEFKISPWQYRDRCQKVRKEYASCKHFVGDKVFPHSETEMKKYGPMTVVAVCSTYNDYGYVDWCDPPMILQVSLDRDPEQIINCTAQYVQKENPIKESVC